MQILEFHKIDSNKLNYSVTIILCTLISVCLFILKN